MKKILVLLVALVCCVSVSFGQTDQDNLYTFRYIEDELDVSSVDDDDVKSHDFGYEVAKKIHLLQENYTWIQQGTAENPSIKMTMVEKPAIYYAVKKLDKHFTKSVKKGNMTMDEAKKQYSKALDIALQVRFQETQEFEEKLRDIKNKEELAILFTDKVKLEF